MNYLHPGEGEVLLCTLRQFWKDKVPWQSVYWTLHQFVWIWILVGLFCYVYLYLSTSLWSFAVNGLNQGVTFNHVIWLSWSGWSWRNAISSGDCFDILSRSHYQSLQMTSLQVVKTSVTTSKNGPSQEYNTIECSYTTPFRKIKLTPFHHSTCSVSKLILE